MTSSPSGDTTSSFSIVSRVMSNEPPSPMSVDGDTSPRLPSGKRSLKPSLGQEVDDTAMVVASTPNKRALMTITQSSNNSSNCNVFNTSTGSVHSFTCTPLSSAVTHRQMRKMSVDCSFTSPIQGSGSKSQDCFPSRWGCSSSQPESSVVQMSPASQPMTASQPMLSSAPLSPHQRSYSESDIAIMAAVSKSDQEPDLIGDFSMAHALPLMNGKHQDLKSISPETLVDLMNGHYSEIIDGYAIVDCRYPYEYEGGHISGAINIFSTEALIEKFFSENRGSSHLIAPPPTPKIHSDFMLLPSSPFPPPSLSTPSTLVHSGTDPSEVVKRTALIFHCEFSSKRGPKLYRFLRSKDREANQTCYPRLDYPEIYILDGGYKAFYEKFQDYCVPKTYTPMDTDTKACRHFQSKAKPSWDPRHGMPYRVLKRPSLKPRNFGL